MEKLHSYTNEVSLVYNDVDQGIKVLSTVENHRSLTPHFIDKYNIPLFFKGFFVNKFSISCSVK